MKITADKHDISLSHPDKIMFPGTGITKENTIRYYEKIADYILPWLKNRPLVMHRYPDGIDDEDFYQKQEPRYFPDWIETVKIKLRQRGRSQQKMVLCNNKATLLYVVNQACITPHVWLSTANDLEKPDRMIFDFDPPKGRFDLVRKGALKLKEVADELSFDAYVMTTGSAGLHVLIPLDGKSGFDASRTLAKEIADFLADSYPDDFTTESRKDKRKGRLFLDYLRNSYGQTSVAPYSLRARKKAPVACPVDWDEVKSKELTARTYTYENIFRRLSQKEDPWRNFHSSKVNVEKLQKKFNDFKNKQED